MAKLGLSKATAFLLNGLFLLTILPIHLLHHHEENQICHEAHEAKALNICHLSLHHPDAIEHCNHKLHFDRLSDDCQYCKILPHKMQGLSSSSITILHNIKSKAKPSWFVLSSSSGFLPRSGNKGPPEFSA
jgi:hypothetical protein